MRFRLFILCLAGAALAADAAAARERACRLPDEAYAEPEPGLVDEPTGAAPELAFVGRVYRLADGTHAGVYAPVTAPPQDGSLPHLEDRAAQAALSRDAFRPRWRLLRCETD